MAGYTMLKSVDIVAMAAFTVRAHWRSGRQPSPSAGLACAEQSLHGLAEARL